MKILFLDIETAPAKGYFYQRYDVNISPDQIIDSGFMMCYQAAWNDGPVFIRSLKSASRKGKSLGPKDDKKLVMEVAALIEKADVVVAHNADRFDLAYISARLACHGLKPFTPPAVIDTLKACRRFFKFEANSLDSVCQQLGLGRKHHSGGFETCIAAMNGSKKAWDKLLRYGKHDVVLLRKVYKRLRAWMKNHPNYNLFNSSTNSCCPACGSFRLTPNGYRYTQTMRYLRLKCLDCGASSRERTADLDKDKKASIITGA
jgi:DNA polymerase elongation subunit (family B)